MNVPNNFSIIKITRKFVIYISKLQVSPMSIFHVKICQKFIFFKNWLSVGITIVLVGLPWRSARAAVSLIGLLQRPTRMPDSHSIHAHARSLHVLAHSRICCTPRSPAAKRGSSRPLCRPVTPQHLLAC